MLKSAGLFKFRSTADMRWLLHPSLILVWVTVIRPAPHLDFWWHLKVGELIVETGSIPRTDAFSFTAEGQFYILHDWLTEVFYYPVYSIGGLNLLIAVNSVLILTAYIVTLRMCMDTTTTLQLAVMGRFPAWWAILFFGASRPGKSGAPVRVRHVSKRFAVPRFRILTPDSRLVTPGLPQVLRLERT